MDLQVYLPFENDLHLVGKHPQAQKRKKETRTNQPITRMVPSSFSCSEVRDNDAEDAVGCEVTHNLEGLEVCALCQKNCLETRGPTFSMRNGNK